MSSPAALLQSDTLGSRLASRGDLTSFFMQLTAEIGADSYMLVAIVHDQDRNDARIVSSNWIFDAIELIGKRLIAGLAQGAADRRARHPPEAAGGLPGARRPTDCSPAKRRAFSTCSAMPKSIRCG